MLHLFICEMSKKVVINKRVKGQTREELAQLSKTELIDKIVQLEAYNFQLKNLLQKKLSEADKNNSEYAAVLRGADGDEVPNKVVSETVKDVPKNKDKQRKFNWTRLVSSLYSIILIYIDLISVRTRGMF